MYAARSGFGISSPNSAADPANRRVRYQSSRLSGFASKAHLNASNCYCSASS